MAKAQKSTIIRITNEHKAWIDERRAPAGLSRDAFVRMVLADVKRHWEADQALIAAAQIRSRAAVADWKPPSPSVAWQPQTIYRPRDLRPTADGDSWQAAR